MIGRGPLAGGRLGALAPVVGVAGLGVVALAAGIWWTTTAVEAGKPSALVASFIDVCLPAEDGALPAMTHDPDAVVDAASAAGLEPVEELANAQALTLARDYAARFGAPDPAGDGVVLAAAPVMTADIGEDGAVSAGALAADHGDGAWQHVCFLNGIESAAGEPGALTGAVERLVGSRLGSVDHFADTIEHDGITHRCSWEVVMDDTRLSVVVRHRVVDGRGFLAAAVSRSGGVDA